MLGGIAPQNIAFDSYRRAFLPNRSLVFCTSRHKINIS
jgi:hypothetical protein